MRFAPPVVARTVTTRLRLPRRVSSQQPWHGLALAQHSAIDPPHCAQLHGRIDIRQRQPVTHLCYGEYRTHIHSLENRTDCVYLPILGPVILADKLPNQIYLQHHLFAVLDSSHLFSIRPLLYSRVARS